MSAGTWRLEPRQPRRSHDARRDQVAVTVKHVSLVECGLPVRSRRIGDVAERPSVRKERRLPAVTPEALQPAHALAADSQAGSAVSASAPGWSAAERQMAAGLLDVLWNLPSYERLVGLWGIDGADATRAIGWLMAKVVTAIEDDDPPPA